MLGAQKGAAHATVETDTGRKFVRLNTHHR